MVLNTHFWWFLKEIDGKRFFFHVNLGMWPLKLIISEKRALCWGFQHTFMAFLKEIDGKTFIFQVNLGMWPLKSIISDFNINLWGCSGDRWENIHFESKNPSIPVLRVSTHIYGISKEIDGKTFIFQVNIGMWPLKSNCLRKTIPVLMVPTHISGDFYGDRWENIHFSNNI